MYKYYLGLGGNIGDVERHMLKACQLLVEGQCEILALSSPYRTPPWGRHDQPDFINAACLVGSFRGAENMLDLTQGIEHSLKRQRLEKWGPRTLDIDILFTDPPIVQQTSFLTLPHPFVTQRAFVLKPLLEIDPQLIINGQSINYWLNLIDNKDKNIVQLAPSAKWRSWQQNK